MKLIITPLVCIFWSICLIGQNDLDCMQFKYGKFEIDNGDGTTSIIERKGKYQTETSQGVKAKDEVVWIDDCSYKLIPKKLYDKSGEIQADILYFTFIKTFENSYIIRVTDKKNFEVDVKVYKYGYLEGKKP